MRDGWRMDPGEVLGPPRIYRGLEAPAQPQGRTPALPSPSGSRSILCLARACRSVGTWRSAPQGPGERAGPVWPTPPTLCKPQTPVRGRVTQAGSCHQSPNCSGRDDAASSPSSPRVCEVGEEPRAAQQHGNWGHPHLGLF